MRYIEIMAIVALGALAVSAAVAPSASASAKVCATSGTGTACAAGHGKTYTGTLKGHPQDGNQRQVHRIERKYGYVHCIES